LLSHAFVWAVQVALCVYLLPAILLVTVLYMIAIVICGLTDDPERLIAS
jgi:hypothetical protein